MRLFISGEQPVEEIHMEILVEQVRSLQELCLSQQEQLIIL